MRPIDADALIEKCGGWYVDECTESGFIGTLENLLATEPTIQPEPHEGHWIDKYPTTYICSECGWLIPDSKVKVFAYCPNCGAKMKGERQK